MADANEKVPSVPAPEGSGLVTSGLDAEFKMLKGAVGGGGLTGSALVEMPRARLKKMASQFGNIRPGLHRQAPSFYHPLFEALNLQLPTKSFCPGTLITMADGTQKIIENFLPGDEIVSHDGSIEVVEFTEHHPATSATTEIKAQGMDLSLRVTSGHKVLALRAEDVGCDREKKPGFCVFGKNTHCDRYANGHRGDSVRCKSRKGGIPDPKPIEAFKLRKGDYVVVPIVDGVEAMKPFREERYDPATNSFVYVRDVEIDSKMMRLLGYYASEGSVAKRPDGEIHSTTFSFNITEKDTLAAEVVSLIRDVFGKKAWITIGQNNTCHIQVAGKKIGEWFVRHCGKLSKEKVLSRGVMFSDPALQTHFLATYANGDGYQHRTGSNSGKITITTASENMANQLAILARRCGMAPTKKFEYRKNGFAGKGHPTWNWIVQIANGFVGPLVGISKFVQYRKSFSINKMAIHRKWIAHRIISVNEVNYRGEVWNIGVRKSVRILVPYNEPHLLLHGRLRGGKSFEHYVQISGTSTAGNHTVIANGYACSQSREVNQWCRHFYKTDGYIGTVLDMHSDLPMTGAHLVCDDEKIKLFFEILFFDVLKGLKLICDVSHEWWKLGNVFPFGEWDDDRGIWTGFNLLNPDFVEVEKSALVGDPILKLDPDDNLKRIVASRQPKELYEALAKIENGQLVNLVARGEKIPLNKFRVSHLAYKMSPYESVGTPIMFRAFKPLIFKDLVRRVQQAVYERHITPIKLVKVGTDTMPATPMAVQQVREAFDELSQDLSAWFVYHHAVSVEYVSSAGKIHPFDQESKWIREEIMAALMGSEAMIGGTGPNFASGSIGLQVLINRYMRVQEMLATWVKDTIFRPVAIAQDFRRTNDLGETEYIVPDIEFEFMKLKDDVQMKGLMKEMAKTGLISKQTFYTYIGLDYRREKRQIEREKAEERKAVMQGMKPGGKPAPGGAGAPPPMGGGGDSGGGEGPVPGEGELAATVPTPGAEMPVSETVPGAGAGQGQGQGLPEAA